MHYDCYSNWVNDIETEYAKDLNQKEIGGFRSWFNKCIKKNKKLNDELKLLQKAKTPEVSLMMASVAYIFDDTLYDEGKHTAKREDDNKKQTRYSSGAFYKAIKLAWDNDELQIDIPNDRKPSSYYWIEVISALQNRFGIFSSLDDLNEFIFSAGNKAVDDSEWGIYGLYLRDINQLCLAYSILHGYSVNELKQLLSDCNNAVKKFCGDPQQTATVEVIWKTFDKFLEEPFDQNSKEQDAQEFVLAVEANAEKILTSVGLHTQVVKMVYNHFNCLYGNEKSIDERRKESKEESYDEYIQFDILRMILRQPLQDFVLKEREELTGLRAELAHRFNVLAKINQVIEKSQDWYGQFVLNLRYYVVALCIKKLSENRKSTNAVFAVEYINLQLKECGFRPIEATVGANNTIKIEMKDNFDWFVVHALKLEEMINPKIGKPISGYTTFMKYVYNRGFQEHKV